VLPLSVRSIAALGALIFALLYLHVARARVGQY